MRRVLIPGPEYSLIEMMRRLTPEEKLPKIQPWNVFRGKVVLSYALHVSGLSEERLAAKYLYRDRSNSGLMRKWVVGESVLSRNSAIKLNKFIPGTLSLFDLCLFPLLSEMTISEGDIATWLKPYRTPTRGALQPMPWTFPDLQVRMSDRTFVPVMHEQDVENLAAYGTAESYCVLLGIVRAADAAGKVGLHLHASRFLYRALPTLLRMPWFAPHEDLLFKLLERVRTRVYLTYMLFDVDFDVIRRQSRGESFELVRHRRPRDPETLRFVELEDPILEADIVPGTEARRLARLREATAERRRIRRSQVKEKREP